MLKDTSGSSGERIVECIITRKIHFDEFNGVCIIIPEGSRILVDLDEEVALYNGHHFDISSDEYRIRTKSAAKLVLV